MVAELPSPRWLVAFDNYKDEEIAEEEIGHVVGRMEEIPPDDDVVEADPTAATATATTSATTTSNPDSNNKIMTTNPYW